MLRPKTTKEVSAVLKYCNSRRLAVVPQGGNTGLVAGSIPVFDEIILSTQLMTDIISVDATSGMAASIKSIALMLFELFLRLDLEWYYIVFRFWLVLKKFQC